jgi:adenine-specific DNA-methyltransferase
MLPSDSVDLVHTSPPYNIDRPYEMSPTDKTSEGHYFNFLERAIGQIKRVVRPGGSVFWQTGYTQDGSASREIIPIDLRSYEMFRKEPDAFLLWDRIIWRYWGGHAFTKKFTNKHETILWYVKGTEDPLFSVDAVRERAKEYDKRNNFWGRNPGNVWEVDRVAYGSIEQTSHIAVFPEELTERIVRACSEPGSLVLDPFAGSGTVPKVAHSLGRRWLGIEISPVYAMEAAIRVGYQQPSETDSLASELIKHIGFGSKKGGRDIVDLERRLKAWASQQVLSATRATFQEDIESVFRDGNGRNSTKQGVWRKYDRLLDRGSASQNSMVLVDQLLMRCYKLRQHLNGVTRFNSALSTLESVCDQIINGDFVSFVTRIASQEPSSYELSEYSLELHSPKRAVSLEGSGAPELVNWQEEDDDFEFQGRLPL